jgi:hypothetical protein
MAKRISESRRKELVEILVNLSARNKLRVHQYSRTHFRIFDGAQVVDYWPTTGKAWITETADPAFKASPADVIVCALTPK